MADHRNTLKSMRLDVLIGKAVIEVIRAVIKKRYDLVIKPAEKPA